MKKNEFYEIEGNVLNLFIDRDKFVSIILDEIQSKHFWDSLQEYYKIKEALK